MSEGNVQPLNISGTRMIFTILSLTPIFYVIMLFALSAITPDLGNKSSSTDIMDTDKDFVNLVFVILLLIIPVQYIIANKVTAYGIENEKNLNNRFVYYLMAFVLYESIAMFGLLIGLLSLFAISPPYLNWMNISIFIIISLYLMRNYISSAVNPWLKEIEDQEQYGESYNNIQNMQ